jgi:hypothetical protein
MLWQKRSNFLSSHVIYKDKNTPLLIFFREAGVREPLVGNHCSTKNVKEDGQVAEQL